MRCETIVALAGDAGLNVVAYLSMAFGNPYGDAWSIGAVVDACASLIDSRCEQISLADTVGLAAPEQIADTVAAVLAAHRGIELGVHLHARRDEAAVRVRAAFDAGCRRFDAAIGGLGGCPFAQDASGGELAHGNIDRGVDGVRRGASEAGSSRWLDPCQRGDRRELWDSCAIASEASGRSAGGAAKEDRLNLQDDCGCGERIDTDDYAQSARAAQRDDARDADGVDCRAGRRCFERLPRAGAGRGR